MILFETGETNRRQTLHCSLVTLRPADTGIQHRQFDVLQSRGARKQIESLKHEADLVRANVGAFIFRQLRYILAIQNVGSLRWPIETANDVHCGRFAGT